MPFLKLSDPNHPLFTKTPDSEGCIEQANKIRQWKTSKMTPASLLGINDIETASHQDIKKAFALLALRFHPDKCPNSNIADEAFGILQQAKEYLLHQKGDASVTIINNIFAEPGSSFRPKPQQKAREEFYRDFFANNRQEDWEESEWRAFETVLAKISLLSLLDGLDKTLKSMVDKSSFGDITLSEVVINTENHLVEGFKELINRNNYISKIQALDKQINDASHPNRGEHLANQSINNAMQAIKQKATNRCNYLKAYENFFNHQPTQLQFNWDKMIKKTEELEQKATTNKHYEKAAKEARELVDGLIKERELLLRPNLQPSHIGVVLPPDFSTQRTIFSSNCLEKINQVWKSGELAKHRGLKQAIVDVTLNLAVFAGTFSLSYWLSGRTYRFFQPSTDSKHQLRSLEDSLNGVVVLTEPLFKW